MAKEDLTPIRTTERAKELGRLGGLAKKGSKHISTHIQEMLEDENFEQKLKDGTILKGRPIEAILKVAIAKARTGDHKFMDLLFKYGYTTKVDITSGGNTIKGATIEFNDPDIKAEDTSTDVS